MSPILNPAPRVRADDPPAPHAHTFLTFLESLYQTEYTGRIVLHFCRGVAKTAEFPGTHITLARE